MAPNTPSMLRHGAEIVAADGSYLVGRVSNVLFSSTKGPTSMEGLAAADALSDRVLDEYPDGVAMLMIAEASSSMPSGEARAKISAMTRRMAPHIRAMALVFEGTGMWMSSMRMVSRTMMMAVPKKFPMDIFPTVEDAAPWICAYLDNQMRVQPHELAAIVARARGHEPDSGITHLAG